MRIKLPKPLGQPRTEPDVSRCKDYIALLRTMQKIKLPPGKSEARQLAQDAIEAAHRLALIVETMNDLGPLSDETEEQIFSVICAYCTEFGKMSREHQAGV